MVGVSDRVGWSPAGTCWTTVSIRRTPPTGLQPGDLLQDFGRVRRPRFQTSDPQHLGIAQQAIELYRLDETTTYADVARDLGCSAEAIRHWVRQADIDDGVRDDG
ncbi:transposase, partial [Mycolicibacterium hippocampi]|uniref:transposase n=1 Tax=Mycolicibacterium hippocampi TaxID=659824 RepID=UPI0035148139